MLHHDFRLILGTSCKRGSKYHNLVFSGNLPERNHTRDWSLACHIKQMTKKLPFVHDIFQFNLELITLLLCSIILPFHQVALANIFPAVRQSSSPDYSTVPSLIICFLLADETSLQSDSVVTLNPRTSYSTSEITGRWSSFRGCRRKGFELFTSRR